MQNEKLVNIGSRILLAILAFSVGAWGILTSLGAIFKTNSLLWALGAEGAARGDQRVLLPGYGLQVAMFFSLACAFAIPIILLATRSRNALRIQGLSARLVLFIAVLAIDCSALIDWFGPYSGAIGTRPIVPVFEHIRTSFNALQSALYGAVLDQAERGASSWIVVIHAAVLTITILILFEVLRWLVRRLLPLKQEAEPDSSAPVTNGESA